MYCDMQLFNVYNMFFGLRFNIKKVGRELKRRGFLKKICKIKIFSAQKKKHRPTFLIKKVLTA